MNGITMVSFGFFIVFVVVGVVIAIVVRFAVGRLDHDRVCLYVEQRGGKVIDANWAPFGPGWFGNKRDRIYHVRYLDRDGNQHEAYAKTSMWTGVYLTEDRIIHYAKPPIDEEEIESLEEENARLRAELERLKRRERAKGSDAIQE